MLEILLKTLPVEMVFVFVFPSNMKQNLWVFLQFFASQKLPTKMI